MKKKFIPILISLLMVLLVGCSGQNTKTSQEENKSQETKTSKIQFKDDLGNEIKLDKSAKRIISLYSAHTENLFALGLDEEIIGVGRSDAYPPKAVTKNRFDYRADPEKVIAAEPDLVLIRPFIKKSKPEFIEALEKANIKVVCLYPDKFEEFPDYIEKLAMLTGKEEKADTLLKEFDEDLKEAEERSKNIKDKVNVFFESTETEYRTVSTESMAAMAIKLAGGNNIADDAKPMREGTSIASYGEERLLEKGDKIDVYVSQRGAMNAGGNLHSITIRPGFNTIKAIKEGRVFTINEKLVSSPTFRFSKGIKELSRMFYPDMMDNLDEFKTDKELTRSQLAKMVVMFKHRGIFAPTSSYYRKEHKGHTYGTFKDVTIDNPNFDYIESAVLAGYVDSDKDVFNPEGKVTREELAKVIYILTDLKDKEGTLDIKDIAHSDNKRIIEIVVENQLMELKDGNFNCNDTVTEKEAVESMEKIK